MKSVLISIRPQWVEKIFHEIGWCMPSAKGKKIYEKSIEVRKNKPNEVPFKAYIYCTGGKLLFKSTDGNLYISKYFKYNGQEDAFNCKVIGEFVCDKVFLLHPYISDGGSADLEHRKFIQTFEKSSKHNEILSGTCLSQAEMFDYIGVGNYGYGWHISRLKIYDKPKDLREFFTHMGKRPSYMIERPPQSWQYVEELENG